VLLADDLNALGRRAYTRDDRLEAFGQLQVPAVTNLSHATMIRLGQLVGATHVIFGSLSMAGNQVSLRAQSIRLDAGRMESEIVEAGRLEELFAVTERLGRRLAGAAAGAASLERPRLPAFEQYIKGLIAGTAPSKVSYLESAVRLDAGFDRARLALWAVHHDAGNEQARARRCHRCSRSVTAVCACPICRGPLARPVEAARRRICDAAYDERARADGDDHEQHRRHPASTAGDAAGRSRDVLLRFKR
jgi:hypothetical protein